MSKNRRSQKLQRKTSPKTEVYTKSETLYYEGALPPAIQLEHYSAIDSSFPNRILKMAEEEAAHRRKVEIGIVNKTFRENQYNNWFGLAAISIILVFCTYLVFMWNAEEAQWVAVALVASVAGIFVLRKVTSNKDEG